MAGAWGRPSRSLIQVPVAATDSPVDAGVDARAVEQVGRGPRWRCCRSRPGRTGSRRCRRPTRRARSPPPRSPPGRWRSRCCGCCGSARAAGPSASSCAQTADEVDAPGRARRRRSCPRSRPRRARPSRQARATSSTRAGGDLAVERAAERRREDHRRRAVPAARASAAIACQAATWPAVSMPWLLSASPSETTTTTVDLVAAGGDRAVQPAPVEHQPDRAQPRVVADLGEQRLGVGHLGHPVGAGEGGHLDRGAGRHRGAAYERGLVLGRRSAASRSAGRRGGRPRRSATSAVRLHSEYI